MGGDLVDRRGRPVTVVSHPRSGTHLTIDFLRRQFNVCQARKRPWERYDRLYLAMESLLDPRTRSDAAARDVARRCPRPVVKTHAYSITTLESRWPEWTDWMLHGGHTIYISRDPRPMLCSLYLYFQSFVPESRVPFDEFLRQPSFGAANRIRFWADEIAAWHARDDTLFLRFEDVVRDPKTTLSRIEAFIGEKANWRDPLLPPRGGSLWTMRLKRFTSTCPDSTAILGFYGGMKSLDWRETFTKKDLAFLKEHAGEAMTLLGYPVE